MGDWRLVSALKANNTDGPTLFTLPTARPIVLSGLTVWAVGEVTAGNLTFQPRINGVNFGSAVVVSSGNQIANVIFSQGGNSPELSLPVSAARDPEAGVYRLDFDIEITYATAADVLFTIYAAARGGL